MGCALKNNVKSHWTTTLQFSIFSNQEPLTLLIQTLQFFTHCSTHNWILSYGKTGNWNMQLL